MNDAEKQTVLRIAYLLVSAAYCEASAKHFADKLSELGDDESSRRSLLQLVERRAREVGRFMLSVSCELLASLPYETRLKVMAALHAAKS